MTGTFLLEQLHQMDSAAGGKATFAFGGTAFVTALTSEVHLCNLYQLLPLHNVMLCSALLDTISIKSILYVQPCRMFLSSALACG